MSELRTQKYSLLKAMSVVLFATLSLLLGACEDESVSRPGVLSVSWKVSPLGCIESGVGNVEVEISTAAGPVGERLLVACSAGRASVEEVPAGTYVLQLYGLDVGGKAIFESEPTRFSIDDGGVTNIDSVRLAAKRAQLDVYWFFDNGRLCASNGIKTVGIGVYDTDGFVINETETPCDSGVGAVEELQSGRFIVEVVGQGADGRGLFRGLQEVQVERGDALSVEIPLAVCEEGC